MMKYKVGDKVRVRKDIKCGEWYTNKSKSCGALITKEMSRFIGNEVTIAAISPYGGYYIKEDDEPHAWEEFLFEGLANEAPSIVKRINEKHNILNGLTNTDTLKPDYYKYRGGDVFDMAKHFGLDFTLGNALKYLLRAGHKDPAKKVEDLNKCIECIKRHIELEG
jgi:hypothetical protein